MSVYPHEHEQAVTDCFFCTINAAPDAEWIALRDTDITYCLQGEEITLPELHRLQRIHWRAYQNGKWAGLDLTTKRVQQSLSLAAEDAARP